MPTATRRPHRKSRHGCQLCKKNRTKCDEQKPSCSRCTRIGATCSLLDPTSTMVIIQRSSSNDQSNPTKDREIDPKAASSPTVVSVAATSPSGSDRSSPELVKNIAKLDLTNPDLCRLILMNHYNQHVAQSICDFTTCIEEGRKPWRVDIPNLAFQNDYLLHCLLSVTALHMALSGTSRTNELEVLAVEHHSRAIALFTPHLAEVTADNIDALFPFTCMTALYSFGIHLQGGVRLSPLAKIHEVFAMLQGSGMVVERGLPWLTTGMWSSWFPEMEIHDSDKLRPEIEETLSLLHSKVSSTITTSSQSEMYHSMINILRINFVYAKLRPWTCMSLVTLPVKVPQAFLQMICIGEPLALAILANWAIILHWLRRHIWIQNWGAETIQAVHEVLPSEWQNCIAFALQESKDSDAEHMPARVNNLNGAQMIKMKCTPWGLPGLDIFSTGGYS